MARTHERPTHDLSGKVLFVYTNPDIPERCEKAIEHLKAMKRNDSYVSDIYTHICLKELGGKARIEQIRALAKKKDPLSKHAGLTSDLQSLRKWRMVDFNMKTKEWHIVTAQQTPP